MRSPKILVFAGSFRAGSFNARLAALAAKELALLKIDVTHTQEDRKQSTHVLLLLRGADHGGQF